VSLVDARFRLFGAGRQPRYVGDVSAEDSRRVVREFGQRVANGDLSVFGELVAEDFVNHAAGPQGRDGFRATFEHLRHDLGDFTLEEHHLLADGQMVAVHNTLHGQHLASTMPLLSGIPVTRAPVVWTFLHLFRVSNGKISEHWACRDDVDLLRQVGAWPPP
jgi:predicted ester cyclase